MRKFGVVPSVCAVVVLAVCAQAQLTNVAVGASTLLSSKSDSASQVYLPAAEKAGLYASFSIDRIYSNHLGFSAEVAALTKRGSYNGLQGYRPILFDVNGVFAPRLAKKTHADFMAGIGGQRVLFYDQAGVCFSPTGCAPRFNSNRFLVHVGADVRYTVWRNFFIRPEVHYYRIFNNTSDFHSDNVVRLGASVGYTFGGQ